MPTLVQCLKDAATLLDAACSEGDIECLEAILSQEKVKQIAALLREAAGQLEISESI